MAEFDGNIKLGVGISVDSSSVKKEIEKVSSETAKISKINREYSKLTKQLKTKVDFGSNNRAAYQYFEELEAKVRSIQFAISTVDFSQVKNKKTLQNLNEYAKNLENTLKNLHKQKIDFRDSEGKVRPSFIAEEPKDIPTKKTQEPKTASLTVSNKELVDLIDTYKEGLRAKKEFEAKGIGPGFAEYEELVTNLDKTKAKYKELLALHQQKVSRENIPTELGDAERAFADAKSKFNLSDAFKNSIQGIKEGVSDTAMIAKTKFAEMGTSLLTSFSNPTTAAKTSLKMLGVAAMGAGATIKKGLQGTISVIRSVASTIGNVVSKLKAMSKSSRKSTNDMSKGFKRSLLTVFKLTFGVRSIFMLMRRLRQTAIKAINTIATQFPEFNAELSQTKTLFEGLKGSLGTALQPIISALLPVINQVIQALTTLLEKIGSVFAALSGQGFIYKATANWQDYADAVDGANKKLGAYDKLNVIGDQNNSNTLDVTYDKEDVSSEITDFVNAIKDAWNSGDFTGIGQLMANKLVDIINTLQTNVVPKIEEFVNKLANSIKTFVNGFFSIEELPKKLGTLLADVGNVVVNGLNTIFGGINWTQIGNWISLGINSILDSFNFENFGQLLGNMLSVLPETLSGVFTNLDWQGLGSAISDTFNGFVDYFNIDAWVTTISTGLNGLVTVIDTFFKEAKLNEAMIQLGTSINQLFDGIDWFDNARKLVNGFNTTIEALAEFIKTIDWLKLARDLVGSITTFINGIDWGSVGELLSNAVIGVIDVAIGAVQGLNLAQTIKNLVLGLFDLILNIDWLSLFGKLVQLILNVLVQLAGGLIGGLVGLIGGIFETVWKAIEFAVGNLCGAIGTILQGIVDIFKELGLNIVAGLIQPIADFFNGVGDWIQTNIVDPMVKWFRDLFGIHSPSKVMEELGGYLVEGLIKPIKEIPTKVIEVFNTLKNKLSTVIKGIAESLKSGFTNMKNTVAGIFKALLDVLKTPINGIIGLINGLISGLISGLNACINALNKISVKVPSWVPIYGGKQFGFSLGTLTAPQIPYLAEGAVIPPNKEFLAMLGDQKQGTNIEAPLDTIKQAVTEVLAEMGTNNHEDIVLKLDGKTVAKVVWNENQKHYKQTGAYGY